MTAIVWFRNDLRLADNPAFAAAARHGPVLPVYILEDRSTEEDGARGPRPPGAASRWWLHHALEALRADLGGLLLLRGDARTLLPALARDCGAGAVHWNRRYEAGGIAVDRDLKAALKAQGLAAESHQAGLLHEPWTIRTGQGEPYKVFTPFWKAIASREVAAPLARPDFTLIDNLPEGARLRDWSLTPSRPNWAADWPAHWQPGEAGARRRLEDFIEDGLQGYRKGRDAPAEGHVSRLSAPLRFGEISPRQIRHRLLIEADGNPGRQGDIDAFLRELGWREFSYHLLYSYPGLAEDNWRGAFDAYPWRESREDLDAWRAGRTGYPLVDAGMRELWQTGYMHNRVRMVAASFLIKHLRIDWREGEAWFWDTLLDADPANNAAGWQWVAGSGADAAPYFRVFNPTSQARKFDADGAYIRRWCPELADLPNRDLHAPFEADEGVLARAGVRLGETYPRPIVDHAAARKAALEGYEAVKARQKEA